METWARSCRSRRNYNDLEGETKMILIAFSMRYQLCKVSEVYSDILVYFKFQNALILDK